jgi:hypothetical protein
MPTGGESHGVSDENLWDRIVTDSDPFVGMSFDEAARMDPRRVDARVQQAVLNTFYAAINTLGRTRNYGEMMQHAYLARMEAFRAKSGGQITAEDLASAMTEDWTYYSQVLSTAFAMKSETAVRLQQALYDNRGSIHRAFREASEVLQRASEATSGSSSAAFLEMKAVISDMWRTVDELITSKTGERFDAEPFGALFRAKFGAIHPGGEWEEYIVSGHRAPSHALPQFRRMGGRFYG